MTLGRRHVRARELLARERGVQRAAFSARMSARGRFGGARGTASARPSGGACRESAGQRVRLAVVISTFGFGQQLCPKLDPGIVHPLPAIAATTSAPALTCPNTA